MGVHVPAGQVDISYLDLLNAGGGLISGADEKAGLIVNQLLSMKNSTISGSGGIGLYLPGTGHIQYSENFVNNSFENNATSAIRIRMDDVNKVVNGNSFTSPSTSPAIDIHMGVDDPLGTWIDIDGVDYDYRAVESLTVKYTKKLAIEAGAVVKMSTGTILQVQGGLEARGTAGSEVIIEGTESKKGLWDGIFVNSTDTVVLDRVIIRDGGGALQDKGNLIIQPLATNVSVTNSTITNSKGYGVLVKSGASDFGINEPSSSNTLEGDLGGFHDENL
jgi:hypothetical protein